MDDVQPPKKKFPQKVLFFSDEHIGAKISNFPAYQASMIDLMRQYDHVVMNGDDFELFYVRKKHVNDLASLLETLTGKSAHAWKKEFSDKGTPKKNIENMIRGSTFFLQEFLRSFPDTHIHKVLGNHENIDEFRDALDEIEKQHSNFTWDPEAIRIGDAVATHAHLQMSRKTDAKYPRTNIETAKDYGKWADLLALLERPGHAVTKKLRAPERAVEMMNSQMHGWEDTSLFYVREEHGIKKLDMDWVKHIFFGHTHVKFDNHKKDGILYHNTGAIVEVTSDNPKDMGLLEAELNEDGTLTNVRPVHIKKDKHIVIGGGGMSL